MRADRIEPKLECFIDQERMYTFEGAIGVKNLAKIVGVLGYDSLQEFLEDNSGVIEAMFKWIGNQRSVEWADRLDGQLAIEDDFDA